MQYAAQNLIPSTTELGGKSPNIFFEDVTAADDAYLDKAIEGLVLYAFNKGEVCTCPSRALIHESIYAEFMERCLARTDATGPGRRLALRHVRPHGFDLVLLRVTMQRRERRRRILVLDAARREARLGRRRRELEHDPRAVTTFVRGRRSPTDAPHRSVTRHDLRRNEIELVLHRRDVRAAREAFALVDDDVYARWCLRSRFEALDPRDRLPALLRDDRRLGDELARGVERRDIERLELAGDDSIPKAVLERRDAVRADDDADVVRRLMNLLPATRTGVCTVEEETKG